tara:strand:- start:725 stop:985 length:261 start_codon:yes stop_codon:yes gene_type:complete
MSHTAKYALISWLILMLSTTASAWGFSLVSMDPAVSTVAIMITSAVKVVLVMAIFMALINAPRAWQIAGAIWVFTAFSLVITIYLL